MYCASSHRGWRHSAPVLPAFLSSRAALRASLALSFGAASSLAASAAAPSSNQAASRARKQRVAAYRQGVGGSSRAEFLPSIRGLFSGGESPGEKVSGTSAAFPEPPPDQPSIGASQSIPWDLTPPTFASFTSMSSQSMFTFAPIVATTTWLPSTTFGAFVAI